MYNDKKRCDNHLDYSATNGDMWDIFNNELFAYYFEKNKRNAGYLCFTMYFLDPFDPVIHGADPNGFCKQEVKGIVDAEEFEKTIERKKIKIVQVHFRDWSEYVKPTLVDRLMGYTPVQPHIKEYLYPTILYKVTVDVPIDIIADYISVDKVRSTGDKTEQIKRIYLKDDKTNHAELLAKKMQRANSLITEMEKVIAEIKANPERYKRRDNLTDCKTDWDKMCRKSDIENRKTYNLENTEYLLKKAKESFEKLYDVTFNAMHFDITKEPSDVPARCAHDKCTRLAEPNSNYCKWCIQLPTIECNYCKPPKKIVDEQTPQIYDTGLNNEKQVI